MSARDVNVIMTMSRQALSERYDVLLFCVPVVILNNLLIGILANTTCPCEVPCDNSADGFVFVLVIVPAIVLPRDE